MMDCARTTAAGQAPRGPEEVRAELLRDQEADRWIEDWITSRMSGSGPRPGRVSLLRLGPNQELVGSVRNSADLAHRPSDREIGWKRLRVQQHGEFTIVQILDHQLLNEGPLAELRAELRALHQAGCARIILNLARVEHVSSQFLEILSSLDRQCSALPGGRLKLVQVGPEVARIIELCGLATFFEIAPGLHEAIGGEWPATTNRFPIEVFEALSHRSDRDSITSEGADVRQDPPETSQDLPHNGFVTIRRNGAVLGTLLIPKSGLRIGRESPCELRLRHRSVSRVHAWLGFRGDQLVLRDLGSSNGTELDGRVLRSESVVLHEHESCSIGPYCLEPSRIETYPDDERDSRVMRSPRSDADSSRTGPKTEFRDSGEAEALPSPVPSFLRAEHVEGVLVLSPNVPQLDDEETVEQFREYLDRSIRQPSPCLYVVLNLSPVVSVSGRVIGLIMAHLLKLKRQGGCLRLAQASPSVTVAMDVLGLGPVIEMFPTIDDAVLNQWPG